MENLIQEQLQNISSKIKKIKARNLRLENENEELRASVFKYLQQIENHKNEIAKVTQSLHHDQIGQSLNIDKKLLQKEIDKYILLIDKCISSVNATF